MNHKLERTVVYLMSGPAHLPYLIVSLYTLRRYYSGPVLVQAFPESWDIVSGPIHGDGRLSVEVRSLAPTYRGKNCQFINKIQMMIDLHGHCDVATYIDADTIFGLESEWAMNTLYCCARTKGFAATQFNNWCIGARGVIHNRIERLLGIPEIDQNLVRRVLVECRDYPSVNGGVFACRPESGVLPLWLRWTLAAKHIFIADETVLHILQKKFESEEVEVEGDYMQVLKYDGALNASPKYRPSELPDEKVAIWHGHGDCWCRPDKSRKGYDLWWPLYQECLELDLGGIRGWKDQCGNKWLNSLERSRVLSG